MVGCPAISIEPDLDQEVAECISQGGTLARQRRKMFFCTIDVDKARYGYCKFSDIRYLTGNGEGYYCSCGLVKPLPGFVEKGREDYVQT